MPNRILKESICTSDSIDGLSWFEEVVFYRLIVHCDDFGRFDGRPSIIKNSLFPLKDEKMKVKSVERAIDRLVEIGLVSRYTANGKQYIFIPTWDDHQSRRANNSKYPDPFSDGATIASSCNQMKSDEINRNQAKANVPDIRYSIFDIRYSESSTIADEILTRWNSLGVANITKLAPGSDRVKHLTKRIKEHGEDAVFKAIDNIRHSSFLRGQNDRGWTITFDWFVKPSNFVKVLEGNYADKTVKTVEKRNGVPYGGKLDPKVVRSAYEKSLQEEDTA